jgi:16S rRNA (guanine(966)-N(2))-methyltransferase RsmD
MLDRVKESLFNIIRNIVPNSRALDLFSGSGALGLEALSRGAQSCVFVEKDPRLAQLAVENAERCKLADRCEMVQADVLGLPDCSSTSAVLPADLVFVDPPYALVDDPNDRASLFRALEDLCGSWVADGAVVVLHHRPIPHAVWPTDRLREWDKRIYGQSQLTFFETAEGCNG